jgi:hypothetical protein
VNPRHLAMARRVRSPSTAGGVGSRICRRRGSLTLSHRWSATAASTYSGLVQGRRTADCDRPVSSASSWMERPATHCSAQNASSRARCSEVCLVEAVPTRVTAPLRSNG